VIPSGNALDRAIHAQFLLATGRRETLAFETFPDDPSDSFIEIWVADAASIRVRVTPPGSAPSDDGWVGIGETKKLVRDGQSMAVLCFANGVCQGQSGRMVLLAMAPTVLNTRRQAAPYGDWQIEVENLGAGPVTVDAWCERDDPAFGTEGGPRQTRFTNRIEPTGTLNSIAHGRESIVVGGYALDCEAGEGNAGPIARYSGTGPGRGLPGRQRNPDSAGAKGKDGPEVLAPSECGPDASGISAAAVLSGETVQMSGTSVAAAYATRMIIDAGFAIPGSRAAPPPSPAPVHRDEPAHPDDGLNVVRWPLA